MDTIHFLNETLPVFMQTEDLAAHKMHSEMSHWHDHIEIIVIGRGSVTCRAAGTSFPLYKGDVCFINRRQLHRLEPGDGEDCCHMVMIIGTALLTQNPLLYEKYIRPVLEDGRLSHIRFEGSTSPAAKIAALVKRAAILDAEKRPGYELNLLAMVHMILYHLYLAYTSAPKEHTRDVNAQIQQQMTEFIYTHYAETLSLNDIAGSGGVSRSQCAKLFNQYTSMSPIRFLNMHRLEISRELLRSTSDPIAVIAQNVGFSDQSYFNRLFVREYGITPMVYRKG